MSTYYVQGRCPACQQESLVLDDDHHVICGRDDCPNPTSATALLEVS